MLTEPELLEMIKNKINKYDFDNKFNIFLQDYFSKYQIYKHVPSVEQFISFSGRLCEDTSGNVEPFKSNEDLINFIKNDYDPCEFYSNHILNNLYSGQKEASYCSGCGWNFVSIQDELERYFDEIKYNLYEEFIKGNKENILKIFKLNYKNQEDFQDNIYDDLDNTTLSDYIVFEAQEIVQDYLDSIDEEIIINIINKSEKNNND